MKMIAVASLALAVATPNPASGNEIEGPGRFCGYSPIIDLLHGEKVTILDGGIHAGSFRWEGAFGALEVRGIGLASKPKGRVVRTYSEKSPARFAPKYREGRYEVAIWNGSHGAAYFISPKPFTRSQSDAIDRVALFEEGQSPSDCKLRTIFSWE